MNDEELIAMAIEAREKAYAPYSGFPVGAALLTRSDQVFTGCNVENAMFGLTVCAERVAVFKAVCAGERDFKAIAVATAPGASPCGSCRQVLREFGRDLRVLVADTEGNSREFTLEQLLPKAFPDWSLEGKKALDIGG
jgi:cytidine deaminase